MRLSILEPEQWPELLTPQEVAALLRYGTSTITRWLLTGEMEGFRVGGQWRIPRTAVWGVLPTAMLESWGEGPWTEVLEKRANDDGDQPEA